MPKIGDMLESKYLKKSDVGDGVVVTVHDVRQQNVAPEGQDPEQKWVLLVREFKKPLVLNSTNMHLIEAALGSDDTDDWLGKKVVLYADEGVSYKGKMVGGIRVRAFKSKKPTEPRPPAREPGDDDEPLYESEV